MMEQKNRRRTSTLIYGDTATGKTQCSTTWPNPKLILSFDPFNKMTPHWNCGDSVVRVKDDPFLCQYGLEKVILVDKVLDKAGEMIARIEFYPDVEPKRPTAWSAFQARVGYLFEDVEQFATIIVDSITFLQNAFLRYDEFVLMPLKDPGGEDRTPDGYYKDPRVLSLHLKQRMINEFMARFLWLETNVVVIAHTSEKTSEFGEQVLKGVNAVGDLRKQLPSGFSECYRAYVTEKKGAKGEMERVFQLQTQRDGRGWMAATQIGAPSPCLPTYDALWGG